LIFQIGISNRSMAPNWHLKHARTLGAQLQLNLSVSY
jgi:hypothetical protein